MAEDDRTRRWQRLSSPEISLDPIQGLRASIAAVRTSPRDAEARRRLRALAAEQGMWEPLALLLADEARAARLPEVGAAFFEELADVHENLDQPLETIVAMEEVIKLDPDNVEHHDRIAWLYRRAGAWSKAAEAYQRVAKLAQDDRSRAALRAAGRIYSDHGRLDHAAAIYRVIVKRRPSDLDAWRALDDLLGKLGRWRELAEVRGELAARAKSGVEKATLLRSQARALEQAGDLPAASELVAAASHHAPENVSGLVDYADVLARSGQGQEAASILAARVTEAIERGAPRDDVAALRLRLAGIFEDSCGDRATAAAVLEELLAAAPEYLPALEWITAHAARDPDPRVHAAALLRYAAALPDDADKAPIVIEAARRFREARDYRSAARVFEDATMLAPDDAELRRELEDAQTALVVERARAEAGSGDLEGAERRLRTILTSRPHNLEANLALAEILSTSDRLDTAAEHLRTTLAAAPDDVSEPAMAPLVHRYALVMAALGDDDEAHQLLHEAHRLDRRSLMITLALGESSFARRLWRQAALHLGSLADHPDAGRHAAAVAHGLVHAAQAEVRALRPANAEKHYEAAIRIDAACAPAWHALAETAIERGDLARAAECLEHEATATTTPRDRLRLFDALGDMAHDVLGDPARAERCWSEVAGIAHAPLLDKLLVLQRRRGAGLERGETAVLLAELQTEPRAKKDLFEEAAQAFLAGGNLARAREVAERLIAKHPRDVDAVSCASTIMLAAGDSQRAKELLRRALGAWDSAGDRGDGDPRRADLWRRLGDAERARGDDQAALAAYRRAVVAAPESDGAHASRRGIVELATTDRSAHSSLVVLVEADQEPDDVLAWARELARGDRPDDARAAFELARAVGAVLDISDEEFLQAHLPRVMASDEAYAAPIDDAERRDLIDDEADGPLAELLEMLGEVAARLCPNPETALVEANLFDAKRVPSTSDAATIALYPQIAKALGGPPTLLYASLRRAQPDVTLVLASPPVVVLGPRLAHIRAQSHSDIDLVGDARLRFQLGRVVELSRARRVFAAGTNPAAFARLVGGLCHAFGRTTDPSADRDIAAEAERLRAMLSVQLRRRITERLAAVTPGTLDPHAYIAGCERAADRAGLLACGDVGAAIALAGGPAKARHLVKLASTQRYLAARRKLRSRDVTEKTQPFAR
jgi:tetratricopeptide (TPR) repeat protein